MWREASLARAYRVRAYVDNPSIQVERHAPGKQEVDDGNYDYFANSFQAQLERDLLARRGFFRGIQGSLDQWLGL